MATKNVAIVVAINDIPVRTAALLLTFHILSGHIFCLKTAYVARTDFLNCVIMAQ